jgi:hypothetical protein
MASINTGQQKLKQYKSIAWLIVVTTSWLSLMVAAWLAWYYKDIAVLGVGLYFFVMFVGATAMKED